MLRARRFGVRLRLLVMVSIALLPVLALSLVQTGIRMDNLEDARRALLSAQARIVAEGQRQIVTEAGAALRALGQQAPVRAGGSLCARALSDALDDLPSYSNIVRLNPDGVLACSALPPMRRHDFSGSDWFAALEAGEDFALGPVEIDRDDGAAVLRAAVPVTEEGRFLGALAASIRLSALQAVAAEREPDALPGDPEARIVALVDREGQVITESFDLGFAQVDDALLQGAAVEGQAMDQRPGPTGRSMVYVVAPLVDDQLFALLAQPAPGLLDYASIDLAGTVLLPLFMYLMALAAVWLSTDVLVLRWLTYLRRIASAYGQGRYSVRPLQARFAPGEMRELAATFDWMARSIARRDEELTDSLEQKQTLLKEIHHRVKNNLQIITSLINLQMKNVDDPESRRVLGDAQTRINALAVVHRSLYEAGDLRRIRLKSFLEELCRLTHSATGGEESGVTLTVEVADLALDAERAIPLALFITEAMTNAYKHAYAGRSAGRLTVRVTDGSDPDTPAPACEDMPADHGECCAYVIDDGLGGVDQVKTARRGVGSSLFEAFARQLGGEATVAAAPGGGRVVAVRFPVHEGEGNPDRAPAFS